MISSKKEVVVENIMDAVQNNHKVLVFANYIHSIDAICKELKKNKIKYLSMTGATKDRHIPVSYTHLDVYKRQSLQLQYHLKQLLHKEEMLLRASYMLD